MLFNRETEPQAHRVAEEARNEYVLRVEGTVRLRGADRVNPNLETGEVEARTAFLVYRSHLETDHQLLSGCREDLLRKANGAWKVARRTIVLDANVLLDKNLSVF